MSLENASEDFVSLNEEEKKSELSLFSDFLKKMEESSSAEERIRISIEFMRSALSSGKSPRFKDFWEARKMCLPLFKENVPTKARAQFWSEYIELSSEAKRVKEILDEQSAFAVEQIELAVQALERDLENYALHLHQSQQEIVPKECVSLQEKKELYSTLQQELNLLNTLATRINAMRKEVVKTEMRIRIKNRFLERLSQAGDRIFPKRKELVKKISQEFASDVSHFVSHHFETGQAANVPAYALREEIKQLQALAKLLTLNTQTFTQTRLALSQCWDRLREQEREKKKETLHKRESFKKNFDLVMEKIEPFKQACLQEISKEECERMASEILTFMRGVELSRDAVIALKEEVFKAKQAPLEKERQKEAEREEREREIAARKREKSLALQTALSQLIEQVSTLENDTLMEKREEILSQLEVLSLSKGEKLIVDRLVKQLKDAIDDKREKALLNLSEGDLKALEELKLVLEERKKRRTEIKQQLELYRKQLGGSGFDFEKAMMYREMIEEEKLSLDKMNASIEEIEQKIEVIKDIE